MAKRINSRDFDVTAHSERMWWNLFHLWHSKSWEMRIMAGNITEIRIRRPKTDAGEVLVILKAEAEGKHFVAFHAGVDGPTALSGALTKAKENGLKWSEDKWTQQALPEGPREG